MYNLITTAATAKRFVLLSSPRPFERYPLDYVVTEYWAPRPSTHPDDLAPFVAEAVVRSGLSVLTPGGRPADSSARSHECACRESHMCPSAPFVVRGRSVFRGRATALGTLRRAESVTCVGGRQRAAERSHRHTLRAGPRAEVRAILELLPRRRNLFLQSEDPGCQRTVHRGARSDDQRAWRQPGRYGTERDFTGHVEQENRSTS